MSKLLLACLLLVAMPAASLRADDAPATQRAMATLPADVKATQDKLLAWIDGLLDKPEADVVKLLGVTKRTADTDGVTSLHYKMSETATLTFYLVSGRVSTYCYSIVH